MAEMQTKTPQHAKQRLPYEAPRISSSGTYERLALACSGSGARGGNFTCAVGAKAGDASNGCVDCLNMGS